MLTRGGDYAWVRPALHAKKLRDLELLSGQPARRGQRGAGYEYNLTKCRQEERKRGERAEAAYRRLTEGWNKSGNRVPAGASEEARQRGQRGQAFTSRSSLCYEVTTRPGKKTRLARKGIYNLTH